ncbi:Membrane transporter of cations and cationic drugs [Thermoplasmatales archaeon BRNA1]|nr:Membrane transporter of cations and cationic drugs [Thermoplasmatales archaeon BRNA1]
MDMGMVWIFIGGIFETLWVTCLTKSSMTTGWTRRIWFVLFFICSVGSIFFLGLGMDGMNIGVAYAIWTAVGATITLVVSRVLFKEQLNKGKILAVFLILTGIIGLELAGGLA